MTSEASDAARVEPEALESIADHATAPDLHDLPTRAAALRAEIEPLLAEATKGPWRYRPLPYDDWGTIRAPEDEDGGSPFVAQARLGRYEHEAYADAHRLAGTDPYEPNARAIVAAINRLPEAMAIIAEQAARIAEMEEDRADPA